MKKIWNWLVYSSVNADKISLTVKGALLSILPIVIILANLAHIKLESDQLTQIVDGIVSLISAVGVVVSVAVTLFGLIRKIVMTTNGTNDVRS